MGSLQNLQIDQSYPGLIKTNDEAAVSATPKALQDGAGNNLPVEVGTADVKFTGGLQLEKSTPTFKITNPDLNRTTYPLAPSGGTYYIDGEDQNGLAVFQIRQDRYGSAYYQNIYADQGESHVFTSINGSGISVPARIAMDAYNGTNNSDNWITGYNERITAGSYNSGTSDLTLTKPDGTDIVVNIPAGGGAAGLESGTGADSMQSAASLTTTAANASANETIALGDGAAASSGGNIAIGDNANAGGDDFFDRVNIAIGRNTVANNERCIAIGLGTDATGDRAIGIGEDAQATGSGSISIGGGSSAEGGLGISIGRNSNNSSLGEQLTIGFGAQNTSNSGGISIGRNAHAKNSNTVAIGRDSVSDGFGATAVGYRADCRSGSGISAAFGYDATVTGSEGTAIGATSQATASQAIALGYGVVAATANTATVNLFQIAGYASMNYADDTAAAAGGIPLGGVYHNAGALRIRIV